MGITAFFAIVIILLYNSLVRKRNETDNAYAGMDVQLKKRYDLIPNLVSVVKQYASHEQDLLAKITEIRAKAIRPALSPNDKVALDNQISAGIRNIMVAVENYPELKASDNFMNLQRSLNEVESQISAARRTYNAVVTEYNNGIQAFPGIVLAGMMNYSRKEVFVIPDTERQNVNINQLFN